MCPPGVYLIALIDTSPKAIHDHLEWELLGSRTKLRVACLMTLRIPNTFNYKLHMGGYSTRKTTTPVVISFTMDRRNDQSIFPRRIHSYVAVFVVGRFCFYACRAFLGAQRRIGEQWAGQTLFKFLDIHRVCIQIILNGNCLRYWLVRRSPIMDLFSRGYFLHNNIIQKLITAASIINTRRRWTSAMTTLAMNPEWYVQKLICASDWYYPIINKSFCNLCASVGIEFFSSHSPFPLLR